MSQKKGPAISRLIGLKGTHIPSSDTTLWYNCIGIGRGRCLLQGFQIHVRAQHLKGIHTKHESPQEWAFPRQALSCQSHLCP